MKIEYSSKTMTFADELTDFLTPRDINENENIAKINIVDAT